MEKNRMDLKTGYSCNNNCLFCILGDRRGKIRDRNTNEVKEELKKAKKKGIYKIVLTGGEVTIRNDIFELIRYAKKLGFKIIHIESNGRMFCYPKFTERIVEAGANSFSISLHAYGEESYSKVTRSSKKAFDEVITGIKNLRKYTNKVDINTTITKFNYKHLPDIIKILIDLKIKKINFPFVNPHGNAWIYRDRVTPSLTDVKLHLHKAINLANKKGIRVTTEMIPFCFMGEYKECVMEQYNKKMEINAPDYFDKNFDKTRLSSRVKGKQCKECYYSKACEGVTKGYAEIYGLSELRLIKND